MIKFARPFSLIASLLAAPAGAHPHVFIDTGLNLLFDEDGKLAAIRVIWAYDELTSLMMVEDRGLDADGDGTPEDAMLDEFAGTDVDWAAGFPGDLYVTIGGQSLALAGATEHGARFEDGRMITHHIRPLKGRVTVEDDPVTVQVYDPTYFVAYDVRLPVTVSGKENCRTTRIPADLNAAYDKVESLLYGPDSTSYEDDNYPEVGNLFADELQLTCVSPS